MNSDSESPEKVQTESPETHENNEEVDQENEQSPKKSEKLDTPEKNEDADEETKNSTDIKETTTENAETNGHQTPAEITHQGNNHNWTDSNETENSVEVIEKDNTRSPESNSPKVGKESRQEGTPQEETTEKTEQIQPQQTSLERQNDHTEKMDEPSQVQTNGVANHKSEEALKHDISETSSLPNKTNFESDSNKEVQIAEKNQENLTQTQMKPEEIPQEKPQNQQSTVIEVKKDEEKKIETVSVSVTKSVTECKTQETTTQEKNAVEKTKEVVQKVEVISEKKEQIAESPQKQSTANSTQIKDTSIVASLNTSRNTEDYVEQIPMDKLDYMSSYQRFAEFDLLIDKGLSLKNRNKLENAASVFEIAVDILNPIYFRNSPEILPKVQKYLIIALCNAASCLYAIERFYDSAKHAHYAFKLDPNNVEALYYLGMSKKKLGDVVEAARVFVIAKRAQAQATNKLFREKIIAELNTLLKENPQIDTRQFEEKAAVMFPKRLFSKRSILFAMGGFIPATIAMYLISKKLKMPKQRGIFTSISSGVLLGIISFLFSSFS